MKITVKSDALQVLASTRAVFTSTKGNSPISRNARLALAAETYARVGIAVADAFIGCWNTKYQYDLIRPISYIQKVK